MSLKQDWIHELDTLRAEPGLTPVGLDALEAAAEGLEAADLGAAAAAIETRLPERGVHPSLHYLLGRIRIRERDEEAALAAFDRLLERLNQDGASALLAEIARRNADWLPAERVIPLLVRAARKDPEAVSDASLGEWLARYPDEPRLNWLAGLRGMPIAGSGDGADAAGDGGRLYLARALSFLAREDDPSLLEEAALKVIEGIDRDTATEIVGMLGVLIERHRFTAAREYLDLALDGLLAEGQAEPLWELLRTALTREAEAAPLRPFAVAALKASSRGRPGVEIGIRDAGLASPDVPFAAALERYAKLMEFAPGSFVQHGSWGVGEVLAHDGESLTVRFVNRPEHVFKRSLADRALDRRDPDDLRVLLAFAPDRLAEQKASDPAGLVAGALRAAGGEAKPRDLKKLLSPAVVAAEEWNGFWKRARTALDQDERIDMSQSFRDVIRLTPADTATPGAAAGEVALPNFEERGEVGRQLKMLRRFLAKHPEAAERAGRAHGRRLERWLESRRLTHEERILILILVSAWSKEGRARLRDALVHVAREGFSLGEFPDAEDEAMLFGVGLEADDWVPVALSALDSKHLPIRQQALTAIETRLGAKATAAYQEVLEGSPARGDAVIEVARGALGRATPALAAVPALDLLVALLKVLGEPERETLRKVAENLLAAGGALMERLKAEPADGSVAEAASLALLNFHASDRYLFPVIEALEQIWGPSVAETLRRRRDRESRRIAARMEDDQGELPIGLMTRASFESLRTEMEGVDLELRTTIPRAIQKARELGDLRENGEFESAKLKQRQFSQRLAQLQRLLGEAQVIEDQPVDGSRVQAGTEVTLTPVEGGPPVTYWVLGEGDSHHGPSVISYRADLGRALWRKRPGEEVELPLASGQRRFSIERITRRVPPAPASP